MNFKPLKTEITVIIIALAISPIVKLIMDIPSIGGALFF